jgi:hypothetical protein
MPAHCIFELNFPFSFNAASTGEAPQVQYVLNTAGGLAVHIQQVHKLEPEKCVDIFRVIPSHPITDTIFYIVYLA